MDTSLSINDTLRIFQDEMSEFEGATIDHMQKGSRLYARAVMTVQTDVKLNDAMNGGVALRQLDEQVVIYPFVFRQVCKNGQIMTSGSIARTSHIEINDPFSAEHEIRETIQACADPSIFESVMQEVKKSPKDTHDYVTGALPKLKKILETRKGRYAKIMRRFRKHEEQSRFGLMNAITDFARDLEDPQERWDLEELGGAIGMGIPLSPPELPTQAKARTGKRLDSANRAKRRMARKKEKRSTTLKV